MGGEMSPVDLCPSPDGSLVVLGPYYNSESLAEAQEEKVVIQLQQNRLVEKAGMWMPLTIKV